MLNSLLKVLLKIHAQKRIKQINAINVLGAENKVPDVTVVILVASFVIDLIKPVFPLLT